MKVTIKEEIKEITYPYIGISEEKRMILFTSINTGTVIEDPKGYYREGVTADDWSEKFFSPFKGTVELSND